MKKIRILLIENDCHIRERIHSITKNHNDIFVIAKQDELKNTLDEIKELDPAVVLINLDLISDSCLSVVEKIKSDLPSAKIIVVGVKKEHENILKLVQAKVNGFVLMNSSPKGIIASIKKVNNGSTIFPPSLTNQLFSQIVKHFHRSDNPGLNDDNNMTIRESEVMRFLSNGMSNKEIGSQMQISIYTVKSHIHNIMKKLSVNSRLEIANYSFNSNIN